jgi:hypothetical protein
MFWRHETEPADAVGHYLGEQLRERLRLALDFATLGAYELTAPEGDAELAEEAVPVSRPAHERPKRVFLFAKVAAPCPAGEPHERPRCAVDAGARRAAKDRPRRRGGGVEVPDQPCLCAAPAKQRA